MLRAHTHTQTRNICHRETWIMAISRSTTELAHISTDSSLSSELGARALQTCPNEEWTRREPNEKKVGRIRLKRKQFVILISQRRDQRKKPTKRKCSRKSEIEWKGTKSLGICHQSKKANGKWLKTEEWRLLEHLDRREWKAKAERKQQQQIDVNYINIGTNTGITISLGAMLLPLAAW